jgi:glutathione synthase/RimK-type ligase-like ATP-grasp enzyme
VSNDSVLDHSINSTMLMPSEDTLRVCILVDEDTIGGIPDDNELIKTLSDEEKSQITFEFVPWRDENGTIANRDWSRDFDIVALRSPYSYISAPKQFIQFLRDVEKTGVPVANPSKIVSWNMDKKYLLQLRDEFGIPIGKSLLKSEEIATEQDISQLFDDMGEDKIVIKPTCSAGSKDTFLIEKSKVEEDLDKVLNAKFGPENTYIVQKYFATIKQGEYSLVHIGGELSHALRKVPSEVDFRVQAHWGGKDFVLKEIPPAAQALATLVNKTLLSLFPEDFPLLYCRIDMLPESSDLTSFSLMEIEMIEPKLWFGIGGIECCQKFRSTLKNISQSK